MEIQNENQKGTDSVSLDLAVNIADFIALSWSWIIKNIVSQEK